MSPVTFTRHCSSDPPLKTALHVSMNATAMGTSRGGGAGTRPGLSTAVTKGDTSVTPILVPAALWGTGAAVITGGRPPEVGWDPEVGGSEGPSISSGRTLFLVGTGGRGSSRVSTLLSRSGEPFEVVTVSRGLGTDLALGAGRSPEPDLSRERPGGGGKAKGALEGGGSSGEEVPRDEGLLTGILEDLLVDILEDGSGWLTKVLFSEVGGAMACDWARLPLEPELTEYSDVPAGSLVVAEGWLTMAASCLLLCEKSTGNKGTVVVSLLVDG